MKRNAPTITIITGLLVVLAGLFSSSCVKEEKSTAVITVKDSTGTVAGAKVRIYGEPSDTAYTGKEVIVDEEKKTGNEGKVTFDLSNNYELGQAGLLVLDVKVTKDSVQVKDFIEVKEMEENTKTIELN